MSLAQTSWASNSSLPLVSSLVKNWLFKNAPDIDEPPFQFIHTTDLSLVDTMLHDSPDVVMHRIEIWAVWRPRVGRNKVWHFLTRLFNCWMCVVCPSFTQTKNRHCKQVNTEWRHYDVVKQHRRRRWVRDIIIIFCFVTTMKLLHALHIYSTVSVKKCMRLPLHL